MTEMVEQYKPDVFWSEGDWEADYTYWRSTDFLAWLYTTSSVRNSVVANDKWGKDMECHHGDFHSCNTGFNNSGKQYYMKIKK